MTIGGIVTVIILLLLLISISLTIQITLVIKTDITVAETSGILLTLKVTTEGR